MVSRQTTIRTVGIHHVNVLPLLAADYRVC